MSDMLERIKKEIAENKVMLFIKGTPEMPQCGFSAAVVEVFKSLGQEFGYMNIFSDPEVRPTLVAYTNWPTTPQVFINQKFIGGCDIVRELQQSGELQKMLE